MTLSIKVGKFKKTLKKGETIGGRREKKGGVFLERKGEEKIKTSLKKEFFSFFIFYFSFFTEKT